MERGFFSDDEVPNKVKEEFEMWWKNWGSGMFADADSIDYSNIWLTWKACFMITKGE